MNPDDVIFRLQRKRVDYTAVPDIMEDDMVETYDVYLSCPRMTICVTVETGTDRIYEGPAIVRKFIGQPLTNLICWMNTLGSTTVVRL